MIKRYLAKRNNPWELLAIAALIFVPGILMLLQKKPMIRLPLGSGSWRDPGPMYGVEIISPSVAHIFGSLAILFSVLIVILYFWVRRTIARDPRPHVVEHGRRNPSNKGLERTTALRIFLFSMTKTVSVEAAPASGAGRSAWSR